MQPEVARGDPSKEKISELRAIREQTAEGRAGGGQARDTQQTEVTIHNSRSLTENMSMPIVFL